MAITYQKYIMHMLLVNHKAMNIEDLVRKTSLKRTQIYEALRHLAIMRHGLIKKAYRRGDGPRELWVIANEKNRKNIIHFLKDKEEQNAE